MTSLCYKNFRESLLDKDDILKKESGDFKKALLGISQNSIQISKL
jgi:hypothetical protein